MRKIFAFFMMMFCIYTSKSQTYVPFPRDSAQWNIHACYADGGGGMNCFNYQFFIEGDTLIEGKLYSKLFHTQFNYMGGLREENKKIYIYPERTHIGMWEYEFPSDTSENLLYNFDSLTVGSSFVINSRTLNVLSIDSVEFDGIYHKRYRITGSPMWYEYWIEGIGSDNELLGNYREEDFERSHTTLCFKPQPDVTYYLWPQYDECVIYVGTSEVPRQVFKIFPNPVSDYLRIISDMTNSKVIITNLIGQELYTSESNGDLVVNVSDFITGIYIIKIATVDKIMVSKFYKE